MTSKRRKIPVDSNGILDRLKEELRVDRDNELTEQLGLKSSVIANWRARQTIQLDAILARCGDVDLNYVLRNVRGSTGNHGEQEPEKFELLADRLSHMEGYWTALNARLSKVESRVEALVTALEAAGRKRQQGWLGRALAFLRGARV